MLKISAFYLDKQTSFTPKKIWCVPCTVDSSYFSQKMATWRPNFPHPRLWSTHFFICTNDQFALIDQNQLIKIWKRILFFSVKDSEHFQPMEVKCHHWKANSEDVPKFPSRKEEQTFDCFKKTVIDHKLLLTNRFRRIRNP